MIKRLIAITVVVLLVISFVTSCSINQTVGNETLSANDNPIDKKESEKGNTGKDGIRDNLPSGLDFGGAEFRIYVDDSNNDYIGLNNYFMGPEEMTGDIVYDTVIARNQTVEERLNVNFKYTVVSYGYAVVADNTRKIILSGEDLYELMVEQQFGNSQLVTEGLFSNAFDGLYFDFDQPWWWEDYMVAASIGTDKRFFLAGDYFIDLFRSAYIVFFNKNIYESLYGDPDELYIKALAGEWTFDEFEKYGRDAYADLNGNSIPDEGDRFGYTLSVSAIIDHFVYGTDIEYSRRDKDGLPVITINNEKAAVLAERMYKMAYENVGAKLYTNDDLLRSEQEDLFINDQILFLPYSIGAADNLREMDSDFGILPPPKFDIQQENYKTLTHDSALIGVIPVTCSKLDMVSAVVEALCAESLKTVMPAYYETALKVKYARDDLSASMIDIIHDTVTSEFIYIYSPSLNKIGTIYRALSTAESYDFASKYAEIEPAMLSGLEKLIEAYANLD